MRKWLRPEELVTLIATAAASGRHGERDALILELMYLHGLRASELCNLLWSDIDLERRTILCRRLKRSLDSLHPLSPSEVQRLQALHKQSGGQPHVFVSERGRPMRRQRLHEIVKRAGHALPINVHCHVLRHSTGASLVRGRQPIRNVAAWLGHAALSSTMKYAHLDETRFAGMLDVLELSA